MFKFCTVALTAICLLSGCVSIPDPIVIKEVKKIPSLPNPDIRPKKILLLFDFSLEYPYIPSGLVFSKEDNIDKTYGTVARILVKKIEDQGIQADYVLHSSPVTSPQDSSGYSHMLIERLDKLTAITSSKGGTTSSYRQWSATLLEVGNSSSPKLIYGQTYMSDGVACFSLVQYAKKEECKTKYIEHLLSHLSPIGITDGAMVTNQEQTPHSSGTR